MRKDVKEIVKKMIESASCRKNAIEILEVHHIFGNVTELEYQQARRYITKEFNKDEGKAK